MFLRYAITGLPPGGMDACKRLGYCEEDFRTAPFDQRPGIAVWLLSFWSDASFAVYRHRETGVVVPFMFPRWHQSKDVREAALDDLPAAHDRSWFADSLENLKENFDYMGVISEALFKANLKTILNAAPRHPGPTAIRWAQCTECLERLNRNRCDVQH